MHSHTKFRATETFCLITGISCRALFKNGEPIGIVLTCSAQFTTTFNSIMRKIAPRRHCLIRKLINLKGMSLNFFHHFIHQKIPTKNLTHFLCHFFVFSISWSYRSKSSIKCFRKLQLNHAQSYFQ